MQLARTAVARMLFEGCRPAKAKSIEPLGERLANHHAMRMRLVRFCFRSEKWMSGAEIDENQAMID